jgi:hypothetical protein
VLVCTAQTDVDDSRWPWPWPWPAAVGDCVPSTGSVGQTNGQNAGQTAGHGAHENVT